ncbi:MAG: hypothetical protein VST68_13075 [Nitrospirota bacterium]|nr:hypothetical protein [Nitrospirota bacterium]
MQLTPEQKKKIFLLLIEDDFDQQQENAHLPKKDSHPPLEIKPVFF